VLESTPAREDVPLTPEPTHAARLSLGSASPVVSTRDHLTLQLDHALARDAVHTPLDLPRLLEGLRARKLQPVALYSAAADRKAYLRRPDLGRTLSSASILQLRDAVTLSDGSQSHRGPQSKDPEGLKPSSAVKTLSASTPPRIAILLADGLSALALERHALPLLDALLPLMPGVCPLIPLVQHARVAIADPIGQILGARLTILLIGERPGLSAPDSLGCYLTWDPRPGRTDAERNCISNIRGDAGLSYAEAAHRIAHYVGEAHRLGTTGIALKDPVITPQLGAGW
jgi:ethanolamine ammonia-lyase small subunit